MEAGMDDAALLDIEIVSYWIDFSVERMFIAFESESVSNQVEPFPWETFDDVSIWKDSDKIASQSANSKSDWFSVSEEKGSFFVLPIDISDLSVDEDITALIVSASIDKNAPSHTWVTWVSDILFESKDENKSQVQFGNIDSVVPVHLEAIPSGGELNFAPWPSDGTGSSDSALVLKPIEFTRNEYKPDAAAGV